MSTPQLLHATPVLPALDLEAAIAFYQQRLGFKLDFRQDDYAGLSRSHIQIHLWRCGDRHIAENTSCRISVTGIDALYQELQATMVIHPHSSLTTQPWGSREFTALDLSGNAIVFTEIPVTNRQRDRTD